MSYHWFHWLVFINTFGWCRCDSVTQYLERWVCDHTYGRPLTPISTVGSHLVCTAVCEMDWLCSSVLFYPSTGDCVKNMDTSQQIGDTSTCPSVVKYVAILQRSCSTTADCTFRANSECAGGVCQCINGYSLTPSEGTCTPYCSTYGDTFRQFPDTSMIELNDVIINGLTLSECLHACKIETSIVCRTVDYSHARVKCYLSVDTAYTQPGAVEGVETAKDWTIAHRNCA